MSEKLSYRSKQTFFLMIKFRPKTSADERPKFLMKFSNLFSVWIFLMASEQPSPESEQPLNREGN